jgi:hypothetical protein
VARRKSASPGITDSRPEARQATCEHCGYIGQAGAELVPYAFARNERRWLCWAGTGKTCFVDAWRKFCADKA